MGLPFKGRAMCKVIQAIKMSDRTGHYTDVYCGLDMVRGPRFVVPTRRSSHAFRERKESDMTCSSKALGFYSECLRSSFGADTACADFEIFVIFSRPCG
jgi:hypothetical protein